MTALSRPAWLRVAPFMAFMAILMLRGQAAHWLPGIDGRWLYAANLLVVAPMLALWWREYGELAWQNRPLAREAALAAAVGLAVFGLWIVLDAPWMQVGEPAAAFVPLDAEGGLMWPLVAVRWAGAALLVPVMEELFWRSFLMRWVDRPDFAAVDPRTATVRAVMLSTFAFTLVHTQWLAAVLAGLAYAALYRATGRLWNAVIAHAVTNAALGTWVVVTGSWAFW